MAGNLLAGGGPVAPGAGGSPGPSPGLAGTLGATPQASPQAGTPNGPQNMLSAGGMQPQPQQAPLIPPSKESMTEAFQKESYIARSLKDLLGLPNLSTKDILDSVGDIVAEQIMSPFQAAQSLKDLPPTDDSLSLRQWVANHYARSMQSLQTVSEMIGAHGALMRRMGIVQPQTVPAPSPMPAVQQ